VSARVVAIDGPSGSGKSTVGRNVAAQLDLHVLDTGAMYRSVTLAAIRARADLTDAAVCGRIAHDASVELEDEIVRLDGEDVSARIRGPEVTGAVSTVSAHPEVRRELVRRQRAWVEQHGGGVVEGRDIGTVVFPDAPVKVFLTASDEERAKRRHRDEQAAERSTAVAEVREALARRDALDTGRAASPLRAADDALVLDTTGRSVDDVVAEIVERFRTNVPEAT
jgi:CMP/dCMP kinase